MKKTIVVVSHPDINKSVVNRYWSEHLMGKVTLHFLSESCPLGKAIDIKKEQALLESHDRIILQFPLYWYSAPSLLKNWLDTVISFGWAYGPGGDKLEGKELGIAVSAGGKEEEFAIGGVQLYPMADYMKQYEGTAAFVRARWIGYHAFYDTFSSNVYERLDEDFSHYLHFIQQS